MPTTSQNTVAATGDWTDILASPNEALQNTNLLLQCSTQDIVEIVAGGATQPDGSKQPFVLQQYDSIQLNAANIWVRAPGDGSANLALIQVT